LVIGDVCELIRVERRSVFVAMFATFVTLCFYVIFYTF
jgi:hypothetical protein